jgi:hypothetical protein
MNWEDFEITPSRNNFTYNGFKIFKEDFIEVLEFQSPGIAAVKTENGWFHIQSDGSILYTKVYERVFGFYFNRAVVKEKDIYYHIGLDGLAAYEDRFFWCGNFQEKVCVVKDFNNKYFHIDLNGKKLYQETYLYTGDFKEGIACACGEEGRYTHIDKKGNLLHNKYFRLLDIYHKGFARAKDEEGWFHINRNGNSIYNTRFSLIEPFYNGLAFCITPEGKQAVVDEMGNVRLL